MRKGEKDGVEDREETREREDDGDRNRQERSSKIWILGIFQIQIIVCYIIFWGQQQKSREKKKRHLREYKNAS